MNKYDKLFNDRLGELMKDIVFEHELLSKFNFNEQVINALQFHTETSLDCSLDEYERVHQCAESLLHAPATSQKWGMAEMYIALIAVQSLSPKDALISIPNWIGFKRHYIILGEHWEQIAAPYKTIARYDVAKTAKRDEREIAAKGKLVQLNGKSFK